MDNCRQSDEQFAILLDGLIGIPIRRIRYKRCEIAKQSVEKLTEILRKPKPNQLDELQLDSCRIIEADTTIILHELSMHSHLKKLQLRDIQLTPNNLPDLLIFLTKASSTLTDLDLSFNLFASSCLFDITKILHENKKLKFLDLSYNNFIDNNKQSAKQVPAKPDAVRRVSTIKQNI